MKTLPDLKGALLPLNLYERELWQWFLLLLLLLSLPRPKSKVLWGPSWRCKKLCSFRQFFPSSHTTIRQRFYFYMNMGISCYMDFEKQDRKNINASEFWCSYMDDENWWQPLLMLSFLFFDIYINLWEEIIWQSEVPYHKYADNIPPYLH